MTSWIKTVLAAVALLLAPAAALAGDIPLGDAEFTTYIQQKLQLYSPAPVRVTGPFTVAIGPQSGANLVFNFKALHDGCVKDEADCPQKTHDYIQNTARSFPAANSAAAPVQTLPSDQGGFMSWVAAELGKMMPGSLVEADGMVLKVTRPGGSAIPFDQRGYYKLCADVAFDCRTPMLQSLTRTAIWLTRPDPAQLRSSLHIMATCSVVASVGNSASCTIRPSSEPMAPFFRKAFANLEEVCFKTGADGSTVPVTNADRRDLDMSINQALDLCGRSTHAALPPVALPTATGGGTGALTAPYAASRVLFPDDWKMLAQQSGGHLIMAVPARDVLLYMNADSEADIAALGVRAQEAFQLSPLGISIDVYRWNGEGWSLATERSAMSPGPLDSRDLMPHVH